MKSLKIVAFALLIGITVFAQEEKSKPRVFVTDSESWEVSGGFGSTRDAATGRVIGGAKPQTGEIIKTIGQKCPGVIVTMKAENANYVLLLEHAGGETIFARDNKYAIFNKDGDSIKSGSTRSLGAAVKESCGVLAADWEKKRTGQE
jgi:hypothetical protein